MVSRLERAIDEYMSPLVCEASLGSKQTCLLLVHLTYAKCTFYTVR
jgi:hypothetical protein